jgi:hypothetical protein
MNIAVITPRYTIAGVPLAQARFARALANKGFNVEFIIGYVEPGNKLPEIEGASVIHLKKISNSQLTNAIKPFEMLKISI